jgi:hypothetical protein
MTLFDSNLELSSTNAQANAPLVEAIAHIRQLLQHRADPSTPTPSPQPPTPSPLQSLQSLFHLSPFERDLLLLCAGMELEASVAPLCAVAQGNPQRPYPTFSLALAVLPNPDWTAIAPNAPLRHWRLIEVGVGNALTDSPLRIDEQILHYLTGTYHLNEQLSGIGTVISTQTPLVPSHQALVEQMVQSWYGAPQTEDLLPVLQLCSHDTASQRAIAAAVCAQLNLTPTAIALELVPTDWSSLSLIKSLWEREYLLNGTALLLEWGNLDSQDSKQQGAIGQFIDSIRAPILLLSQTRYRQKHRPILTFEVASPTSDEQRLLWQTALSPIAPDLNGQVEGLVSHFNFTTPAIHTASLKLKSQLSTDHPNTSSQSIAHQIWNICRVQARPRLDELAQRMESTAEWQDLVLPDQERQVLRDAAIQLKQRTQVYEQWGFGGKSKRGLGISALFAGASGTGKTLAAEVLAQEIQLDLYRIDLSAVVSKYIGETEKNLGRVFDAAEVGGVILLFDEADALFGKRSEVKDSHDRYANMEVSYLLQRMEAYRGLAILTTNLKSAIDQAFLRRIRFIVQFPFPDAAQRAEIWRRVFPPQTPTEGLEVAKLAKLSVAGGNIRNIALNAAFLAAAAAQPITMEHILQATRSEYTKLERPLTDAEVKGWV